MKKKTYQAPEVKTSDCFTENMLASSFRADNIGIGYGGQASDHDIIEADANSSSPWDIW